MIDTTPKILRLRIEHIDAKTIAETKRLEIWDATWGDLLTSLAKDGKFPEQQAYRFLGDAIFVWESLSRLVDVCSDLFEITKQAFQEKVAYPYHRIPKRIFNALHHVREAIRKTTGATWFPLKRGIEHRKIRRFASPRLAPRGPTLDGNGRQSPST